MSPQRIDELAQLDAGTYPRVRELILYIAIAEAYEDAVRVCRERAKHYRDESVGTVALQCADAIERRAAEVAKDQA